MDKFRVIITPDAAANIISVKDYIALTLKEPQTALKLVRALREKIEALDSMPGAIALVPDEPWRSRGLRRILYKNFYVYYYVDVEKKRVYVMNVIYARSDRLNELLKYE